MSGTHEDPFQHDPRLDMSFGHLFDAYVAERALGPETRTLGVYRSSWRSLSEWAARELGREPRVIDLSNRLLNAFLVAPGPKGERAESSRRSLASNIRSVVSKSRAFGLVPPGVLAAFELPAVTARVPSVFDDEALAAIFEALEAERTAVRLRLRAVANLMLDTGARPAEVASIALGDAAWDRRQVRLSGKGAKDRLVPLGERSLEFIDDYMRIRPTPASPDEPLFLAARGERRAVASTTLASDMRDVLREVGLVESRSGVNDDGRSVSLYTVRKTFARRAAEGGMDVSELAALMGHEPSSIPMLVERYYRPTITQTQRAHANARPADAFHEWRARRGRDPKPAPRPGTLFERWAPVSTAAGKMPRRIPSSRNRTSGA
jgi:site-specific recombinase XerD